MGSWRFPEVKFVHTHTSLKQALHVIEEGNEVAEELNKLDKGLFNQARLDEEMADKYHSIETYFRRRQIEGADIHKIFAQVVEKNRLRGYYTEQPQQQPEAKCGPPKVVIINGYPRSGKDTFIELCGKYCKVKNISTVDKVKEALKLLGWNGEKTAKARSVLSDLKDMSTIEFNGPYKYVCEQIENTKDADIIFVHCREPKEIERIRKAFNGKTLLIRRDASEKNIDNHADKNVEQYIYDAVIENNGTIENLESTAGHFLNEILFQQPNGKQWPCQPYRCYCCGKETTTAIILCGTQYFMCNDCLLTHVQANAKAVEEAKRQMAKVKYFYFVSFCALDSDKTGVASLTVERCKPKMRKT